MSSVENLGYGVLNDDGDVVPLEDMPDLGLPPNNEIIAKDARLRAVRLMPDMPEVKSPETVETAPESKEAVHTDAYDKAVQIIESGVEKSKAGGYSHLKVEVWHQDPQTKESRKVTLSLSQYFGGNELRHSGVTTEEFEELFRTYGHLSAQYEAERIARPVVESGRHRYRDFQSAAAGDRLDDD